jgi:hypothetical protein
MLGEFFAAPDAEVDDPLAETGPHGRFPTVEANGLSHVPIARLGELLSAGTYDVLMGELDARPSASGNAVLFRIPRSIRDAIGASATLDEVAQTWSETDELSLSGWRAESAREVLGRLAELARTARSADEELWYWWSL